MIANFTTHAFLRPYVSVPAGPVTTSMGVSWSAHIVANGGAAPSSAKQTAVSVFWTRLVNDSIAPMIYEMAVFTDSISASVTPITSSINNWKWTNQGFVEADLDFNGLYASGSAKYIDTGVACSVFTSSNDAGASQYIFDDTGATNTYANDWGILGTQRFIGADASNGASYFDCWAVSNGRVSGTPSGSGLFIHNRTSNTDMTFYMGNSSYPSLQTVASRTNAAQQTRPAGNIYVFRQNGDGNARNVHKLSFFAIHRGFTLAQARLFFAAVQQLRTDLGGGYK